MDDRVLVVEDERILHPIYARIVELSGAQAEFAVDGSTAGALIMKHHFACALIDRNLPDGDGLDLATALRQRDPLTEILVVTAHATLESAIACIRLGGFDYVLKPFRKDELAGKLKSALERHRAKRALQARVSSQDSRIVDLEAELGRRAALLQQADRLATLGTLAGGVGHEVNNITSALLGVTYALRHDAEHGQVPAADLLEDLDRVGGHLKLHGAQLLNLARPARAQENRLDLRSVLSQTLSLLAGTGKTKHVAVDTDVPAEPVWVVANRTRVEQVLINLVANAADAVRDTRPDPRITVTAWRDRSRGRVFCRVEDNGPGIPPAVIGRIFEPYFTSKPPGEGTGLGLPVARQIVESYGGTLSVDSQEGRGTAFVFDLPEAIDRDRSS